MSFPGGGGFPSGGGSFPGGGGFPSGGGIPSGGNIPSGSGAAAVGIPTGTQDSTTMNTLRFELAWLIIWILLSVALIVVLMMKRLNVPRLLPHLGSAHALLVFALQGVGWVLTLAALADDEWATNSTSQYGVTASRSSAATYKYQDQWDCNGNSAANSDAKNTCNTPIVAAYFTLIFGLFTILAGSVLLFLSFATLIPALNNATTSLSTRLFEPLQHVQWVSSFACLMIWGVCGYQTMLDAYNLSRSDVKLGASWGLMFVVFVMSVAVVLLPVPSTSTSNEKSVQTSSNTKSAAMVSTPTHTNTNGAVMQTDNNANYPVYATNNNPMTSSYSANAQPMYNTQQSQAPQPMMYTNSNMINTNSNMTNSYATNSLPPTAMTYSNGNAVNTMAYGNGTAHVPPQQA